MLLWQQTARATDAEVMEAINHGNASDPLLPGSRPTN
jgi:hypothetical protein